jgi:hypothetical protein
VIVFQMSELEEIEVRQQCFEWPAMIGSWIIRGFPVNSLRKHCDRDLPVRWPGETAIGPQPEHVRASVWIRQGFKEELA